MSSEKSLREQNVKGLLGGYQLSIPAYQRIYAWEEEQYKQFWQDILDYLEYTKQNPSLKYFIGHILLEKEEKGYSIVDGQQRITTMVIVLNILQKLLNKNDVNLKNFSTGDNEKDSFNRYIIDGSLPPQEDIQDLAETASMRHCLAAHQYFYEQINKNETKREAIYNLLLETGCTIQIMEDKIGTVRRFIFENDRGKPVNKFEKFKTLCMYELYIQGKDDDIKVLEKRVIDIYRNLEAIHSAHYQEDMLLRDTAHIYFNDLKYDKLSPEEMVKDLKEKGVIDAIDKFSRCLLDCAETYKGFINNGEGTDKLSHTVQALCYLGVTNLFRPFIIKAYLKSESEDNKFKLLRHLEHLLFRHKLIGTRADLETRIHWMFPDPDYDVNKIVENIQGLLFRDGGDWWWKYWSDEKYKEAVEEGFIKDAYHRRDITRYVLYKYEYDLWAKTKQTLPVIAFGKDMAEPTLEHIAPRTPSDKEYDDEFKHNYLNALGNLILIPKRNNSAASNDLKAKCKEYGEELNSLRHVQKVKDMVCRGTWGKTDIQDRTKELKNFILKDLNLGNN